MCTLTVPVSFAVYSTVEDKRSNDLECRHYADRSQHAVKVSDILIKLINESVHAET